MARHFKENMSKRLTKEQQNTLAARLETGVLKVFEEDAPEYRDIMACVTVSENGYVIAEVWQMYEYLPLSFAKLEALAKLFGTRDFQVNQWSSAGCETCDYGSSYRHEFSYKLNLEDAPENQETNTKSTE